MRVDTSLLQGITAANNAAARAQQSSALKNTGTNTTFASALKSATSSAAKETTKPVEGQNYSEILTGPRAGMYVNTSGNGRDGEAFILVKGKDGSEQHIYGTGKDRTVVSSGKDGTEKAADTSKTASGNTTVADKSHSTSDKTSTADRAPANERTKQVPGRAYADILNGRREGLYLNTSGNVRDGQVFSLVKRDGREFHIYGTGKDREIIGLVKKKPETADDTKPVTTDKTATDKTSTTDKAPSTGQTPGTTGSGQIADSATT